MPTLPEESIRIRSVAFVKNVNGTTDPLYRNPPPPRLGSLLEPTIKVLLVEVNVALDCADDPLFVF